MHSSRMRTARSLTIQGGGESPWQGGLLVWGGLLASGVSLPEGLLARGESLCQGVSLPGGSPCWGSPCWGVSLLRGCVLAGGLLARRVSYPPVDRMTDRCKNITFANFVCGW